MISEYRATTWGNEISLEYGKGLRGYKDAEGPIPVFGTNGQVGWTDKALAPGPGIILGRKGAYRGINYSEGPFFVIDTAYYVKPKTDLDMRWLYYAMIHHRLGSIDDGSPIPSTTRAAVYIREVDVPGPVTQSAVAKILGDLDDKIDLLREMNATLEDIARSLFRAWFVDFEPIRTKVAGANSFPGMPPELFDALPDGFENSEIGEIPKGWETGKVKDVLELRREAIKPFEEPKTVYQHFSLPAFDRNQNPDVEIGDTIKSGKYSIPEGSVLFSKLNPRIPRIWIPRPPSTEVLQIASTEFLVCKPREGWSRAFVFSMISQNKFIEELTQQATGTSNSHQRIKPAVFEDVDIAIPPKQFRLTFSDIVSPVLKKTITIREQQITLEQLRDTLLPKLISGEIEAPDLEVLVDGG